MTHAEAAEEILLGERWCNCIVCQGKGITGTARAMVYGLDDSGLQKGEAVLLKIPCRTCGASGQALHMRYQEALEMMQMPLPKSRLLRSSEISTARVSLIVEINRVEFESARRPTMFKIYARDTIYTESGFWIDT